MRLADPGVRRTAITRRPLLLHAVARQTRHAGQTGVTVTPLHADAIRIQRLLTDLSQSVTGLQRTAEQLTDGQRWGRILSRILQGLLGGRKLTMPVWVSASG